MRQRTSYIVYDAAENDPSKLTVKSDSLSVQGLKGAKEQKLTFTLSELPQELYKVLKQCRDLHIRWTAQTPYRGAGPFVSRVSPGLHVLYTPRKGQPADQICPLLQKVFGGLKCDSPQETFIEAPTLVENTSAPSLHYYQLLPSLRELTTYIQQKICSSADTNCQLEASTLQDAGFVDLDYDATANSLIFTAFWGQSPSGSWSETIKQFSHSDTVEVGVLNVEASNDPSELSLGGFLTVLGRDTKPKPTLFSFPAKHHPIFNIQNEKSFPSQSSLSYTMSFEHPTGLHPTLKLSFPSKPNPPSYSTAPGMICTLHTYLTLPSALFIDRYQLADSLFLSSHNLDHLLSLSGETDLEAPNWVIRKWGSAALLQLATTTTTDSTQHTETNTNTGNDKTVNNQQFNVTIPLHFRYMPPNNATTAQTQAGQSPVHVPWPVVFWACPVIDGTTLTKNPFDRAHLGYDDLFGPRTLFFHVPPAAAAAATGINLVETISVPVLDLDRASYVEIGTLVAVLVGMVWVLWKLMGVVGKMDLGGEKQRKD